MDAKQYVEKLASSAKSASVELARTAGAMRNKAILACAENIRKRRQDLQAANSKDLTAAKGAGLSDVMIDRLRLTDKVIESMTLALEQIAAQVDPVGRSICAYNRPNGLRIEKRRVPIGVVGIIYESRPNVTADAAGLCLKSANACILRGGKEAMHSNMAIAGAIHEGIQSVGLPRDAVCMVDNIDRAIVTQMSRAEGLIDVIIARGGESLIRAVVESATIPVLKHYRGNCHVYVHAQADLEMAQRLVLNAKCQRPSVCNAAETLLVDRQVAGEFLPRIAKALKDAGVELRGCPESRKLVPDMTAATEQDYFTEYLDLILAVKVVENLQDAIVHINRYGSKHTDAIVTESIAAAEDFVTGVDSASVMVNASTRLSDGGEYGLGAEVGISTDKLHARGPMGAEDLTTYKWVVTGRGHIRQ